MSSQIKLFSAGVAALVLLLLPVPAQATVLGIYSDRATWEGLVSGQTNIDFSVLGIPQAGWPAGFQSYSTVAGLTTGGVNFTGFSENGSPYDLWALNPLAGLPEDYGSGTVLRGPTRSTAGYLRIILPTNVTAFGIDLGTVYPAAQSFQVIMDGVTLTSTLQAAAHPNRIFFGVRTDTPISELQFYLSTGTLYQTQGIFDNVSFGSSSEPPAETAEATTLLYIGSGLGLLLLTRRHGAIR